LNIIFQYIDLYFLKDSNTGLYYHLHKGWKEFIQYVMELTNHKIIFFSRGETNRNEMLVSTMLTRLLQQTPTANYIKQHVQIFSKEHVSNDSYGKDLTVVVDPTE
jgi:rhamnogalacturonyl hydrolase YesR